VPFTGIDRGRIGEHERDGPLEFEVSLAQMAHCVDASRLIAVDATDNGDLRLSWAVNGHVEWGRSGSQVS
jgi:hypothetical protein